VGIDVHGKIVALRRGRVESGVVPAAAEDVFVSSAARFNPFQKPNEARLDFALGLPVPVAERDEPVELLYWIGCAGSFDPQGQSVARSMINVLNHLQIPYRVLGPRERCTGDPARRMGEEGLFQELARENLSTLREHRVQRILTHCPHCFNTLRNEYPDLQARPEGKSLPQYEVIHHTEFLAELVAAGRIRLQAGATGNVTYHDPCYLGRGNGVTAAPRDVIAALPGVATAEMPRNGKNSFCCGAGGGAMWLDVRGDERVENIRFREAAETGAQTIVTGCPFCKTMLDAARAAQTGEATSPVRQVKDVAELVSEGLGL
jgi:Fe-S oxidoreductase